ncbi:hypothetical protein [Fodinibius salsisoli]|nr:hypothetical protein [Fodinibius salsisoli]
MATVAINSNGEVVLEERLQTSQARLEECFIHFNELIQAIVE